MSDQDKTRLNPAPDISSTVIRPRPGGRPLSEPQSRQPAFEDRRHPLPPRIPGVAPQNRDPLPRSPSIPPLTNVSGDGKHSPLVEAAAMLFFRVTQVRHTASEIDVYSLRRDFVEDLAVFDQRAQQSSESPELITQARYALCTFADETVLTTPWGNQSRWQEESLLSTYFNETWGGDRFFAILDHAKQQPGRTIALLEVLFVCLMLGFEGKYHVLERGRSRREEVIDDLFRIIRSVRGDPESELSPHWRGAETEARVISDYLPLWVFAAVALALLMALYLAFRFALSGAAYPVFDQLAHIGREPLEIVQAQAQAAPSQVVTEPPPPPVSQLRLSDLLRAELNDGILSVEQDGLRSLIRINSDTLFRSGSATVESKFIPILQKIGDVVNQVTGRILVVGHSDNIPIKTLQFPSNWELSRARAVNVMKELGQRLTHPDRLTPEGRADTEPLVANDTPANRAKNRRVEIYLFENPQIE